MGHRKSSKKYCEIRKCGIYDNKGFTLVELLVGIAIVAIVGGLIGTFLIFSTPACMYVTDIIPESVPLIFLARIAGIC